MWSKFCEKIDRQSFQEILCVKHWVSWMWPSSQTCKGMSVLLKMSVQAYIRTGKNHLNSWMNFCAIITVPCVMIITVLFGEWWTRYNMGHNALRDEDKDASSRRKLVPWLHRSSASGLNFHRGLCKSTEVVRLMCSAPNSLGCLSSWSKEINNTVTRDQRKGCSVTENSKMKFTLTPLFLNIS